MTEHFYSGVVEDIHDGVAYLRLEDFYWDHLKIKCDPFTLKIMYDENGLKIRFLDYQDL